MEWSRYFANVAKGVLRALIATMIFVVIISIVMSFSLLSLKALSVMWVVVTCLSILLGAIYSSRKNGEKGWLVGFGVGLCYFIIVLIISAVLKGNVVLSINDLWRALLALAVGALSGMLGINL
ncbi:TIGR04086 family membrane protein [Clostridium folliculivorans]|uniref:Membrane protein n=1 Tax=Clostridium folliculivorans TaxID=2886038 RepID=A0A9W5XZN7_9CLOT|nr:TIGR04086 family membrane protein [Clostridium folliculivorans]GKU23846.1 membrane protein [Clostridium folliculivorans]GKU29962.1 membrane protein [Clostridium folliculivorans]